MASVTDFGCVVCGASDKWLNVDEYRYSKAGMCLCQSCGFVTYPEIQKQAKDLTEFYRAEYREAPSVQNLFSGERKLHYHAVFLDPLFKRWASEGVTKPTVLEIGSAFGMFLQWFKQKVPGAEINGTELTLSFRRNAWWLYNIRLDEEADWSKKYDFIASYKVAEHIPNIDKELRKYALALKEKGFLYISVPTWFGMLCNFGLSGFSLEYYYHKNHINVWSRKLFETLLKKSGLKVVSYNGLFYDDTYLCVRDDSLMDLKPEYDDPALRLEELKKIHEAALKFDLNEFEEAIKIWPNFPDAHMNLYEMKRGRLHEKGLPFIKQNYLEKGLKDCPTSANYVTFVADVLLRYEDFNSALKYLELVLEMRPNDVISLTALGHCYRQMAERAKNQEDKIRFIKEAREVSKYLQSVSKQNSFDAITWQMQDNARLPMPFEAREGGAVEASKEGKQLSGITTASSAEDSKLSHA